MGGWRRARASAGVVVVGAAAITAAVFLDGGRASASTSAVPPALVGCWHRHVPALPVGTSAGVWLMKITRGGELLAYTPGTTTCGAVPDFTATISVAGSHLTIGSVPVCTSKGVYTWKAVAKSLTLQAIAEKSCAPRRLLFTGVWKKT
jgi:hypothetical protein